MFGRSIFDIPPTRFLLLVSIIEYLEKVEKIMGQMHWEIKNIIDINKMEQL